MDFNNFDRRNYPTVPASIGYGEWASKYEESVPNQLDFRVLESLKALDWSRAQECLDLACGTGRTGEWLKAHGVATIDGIDLTPQMLERARARHLGGSVTADNTRTHLHCAMAAPMVMSGLAALMKM